MSKVSHDVHAVSVVLYAALGAWAQVIQTFCGQSEEIMSA
jgi:hypothetical protein